MKLDHIGIATRELEKGLTVWRDALGLKVDATEEIIPERPPVAVPEGVVPALS